MATDSKKFQDVWCMNEEEAKELVNKILEQDRILHEVQMGIPWEAPDVWVWRHNIKNCSSWVFNQSFINMFGNHDSVDFQ